MTIKLDKSAVSGILITCSRCEFWFAFRFDQREAYLSGEGHEMRVHDVPANVADNARRLWERRSGNHS